MSFQAAQRDHDYIPVSFVRNEQNLPTYEQFIPLKPQYVAHIGNIADAQRAIIEAAKIGFKVRPYGAGQSWAPELMTSGVSLDMRTLNRIHGVNTKLKTISVGAGTTLGDVSRALGAKGLALPSLPFREPATIGGIVSTATHATSHKWGTVSDFVRSIDIVDGSGKLRQLGPESSQDELRAARVSVGELGVITRVELQAIDMPWVRFQNHAMDLREFLRDVAAIQAEYDHIWVHWELGTDKITLDCLEVSTKPRKGFHTYVDDRERRWEPLSPPMSLLSTPLRRAARGVMSAVRSTREAVSNAHALGQPKADVRISMQYAVPAKDMAKTIAAIKGAGVATTYFGRDLEIKFVKGSDATFLGPNTDGDSALFNLYWLVPKKDQHTVLIEFESLMQSLNARPHWGKYHETPSRHYMRAAYPQWDKFERIRDEFDPIGLFSKI